MRKIPALIAHITRLKDSMQRRPVKRFPSDRANFGSGLMLIPFRERQLLTPPDKEFLLSAIFIIRLLAADCFGREFDDPNPLVSFWHFFIHSEFGLGPIASRENSQ
jgi:hypothetical protein